MKKTFTPLIMVCAMKVFAADLTYDGLNFNITSDENKTCQVTKSSVSGDVIIPSEVEISGVKYNVTSIDDYAFDYCQDMSSVEIPQTITTIGKRAFNRCDNLTNITIPNSVTSIREFAFSECYKLSVITIPASVTLIGDGVLAFCKSLEKINVADTNENFCTVDGLLYTKNIDRLIVCPAQYTGDLKIPDNVKTISSCALSSCMKLTSLEIPESVTGIGSEAFHNCTGLISITNNAKTTTIEIGTYYNCSSMKTIPIPEGVTTIKDLAFGYNLSLETLTFPASVTYIEGDAFDDCTAITDLYFQSHIPPTTTGLSLTYFSDKITLHVPVGTLQAYKNANEWNCFTNIVDDIIVSSGVENVGLNNNISAYNLQGLKVDADTPNDLPAGIYIINNKKVLIK